MGFRFFHVSLCILIFSWLFLSGCTNKLNEDDFLNNQQIYLDLARDVCANQKMQLAGIHYKGFYKVNARCLSTSPIDVHEIKIELER